CVLCRRVRLDITAIVCSLKLYGAPRDGGGGGGEKRKKRIRESVKNVVSEPDKLLFESLILAQDERWRRA
ncbi:hypothetical protein BGU94_19095, partial [Clostridioides difficile]